MNPRPSVLGLAFLLLATVAIAQTETARITYTKEFPGSQPDYISLSIQQDGQCGFRTAPDEKPFEFQLAPDVAGQIFTLAQKLNFFQNPSLESKKKVAQMGKKTFIYEKGTEQYSQSFNYTTNPDGLALTRLVEGLSRTLWRRDQMLYALRYDRLGIVDELLQTETDLEHSQLIQPDLLLPLLQKIQADDSLVHVAQERATILADKIHTAKQ